MAVLWWKRALLALAGLAVAGGLVWALAPQPVPVDVARIGRGEMRVTVDEEGKTRIKDVYVVSAPISGKVLRSRLHVGDDVSADETVVASLMPAAPPLLDVRTRGELEALVGAAEAAVRLAGDELAQAQSEAAMAELDLTRARDLARRGFVARRVLDKAEADARTRRATVDRAKSAVEVRESELRSARARLIGTGAAFSQGAPVEPILIVAPVTGRVLRIPVESETVAAQGTPLVEIGDPGDLEIIVDLLSSDAVKVAAGAEASVESWGGEEALAASVRRIEPTGFTKVSALGIEEQRVRAVLDLSGPPAAYGSLGHDYRVFVRILVWRSADALRVPLGALFRDGDRWAVFKIVAGRARLQRLVLGHRNADHAVVLEGLAEGDEVVLHPSDRVTDSTAVVARQ